MKYDLSFFLIVLCIAHCCFTGYCFGNFGNQNSRPGPPQPQYNMQYQPRYSQHYHQSNNNRQQGGHNMQQGGYNMQQGGYNMQQGGYNMQQGGYNSQQGGFNSQHASSGQQAAVPPPAVAPMIPGMSTFPLPIPFFMERKINLRKDKKPHHKKYY